MARCLGTVQRLKYMEVHSGRDPQDETGVLRVTSGIQTVLSGGGHRRLHLAFPAADLTALGDARAPRCLATLRAAVEGKSGPATAPST